MQVTQIIQSAITSFAVDLDLQKQQKFREHKKVSREMLLMQYFYSYK